MILWIGYIPKSLIHNSLVKGDIRVLRQLKSTGGCQTKYTGATGIQEQRAMFQKEAKNLVLESFLLDKDVLPLYKLEPKKLFYPTKVSIFYLVSCEITKYIFKLKLCNNNINTKSHVEEIFKAISDSDKKTLAQELNFTF